MEQDTFNLRSDHSCDYCENANYYNLKMFGQQPSLLPADESEGLRCDRPQHMGKENWTCTRVHNHEGPCALVPLGFFHKIYWAVRLKFL
jgi:hypothetical protein